MVPQIHILLHNIRSTHNVGSIFRTADAAGISKIYISGHTPSPVDRFGRIRKDIAKVALGAEKSVVWEYIEDVGDLISMLKREGFNICAVEQDKRSINYREMKINEKNLFIFGSEVSGIEKTILNKCNQILEISMKGEKESLNVSVAAGIVLFHLCSRC